MNISLHQLRRLGLLVALVVSVVAISGGDAIAVDIPAGYDNFFILPTSTVDFVTLPIPADFFGPGSDPFNGTVPLEGDTIIERLSDANFSGDPLETTVQIELVALNLVSCDPISISFSAGSSFELWNLVVELPGPAHGLTVGTLTATKTHANGGTFDSILNVQPIFTFIRVSDQQPSVYDYHDNGDPPFNLTSAGDDWSNQNPVGIPPNTSNFYPGGTPGNTNIPPQTITFTGGTLELDLVLVPEPATLSLLVIGGLAMLRRRRK